jgi:hypothetical protein
MTNILKEVKPNNMSYMTQFNNTVKESLKKIAERKEGK